VTIYARSDVNVVQVSGAGHEHRRPFVEGLHTADPVLDKTFAVSCPFCEPELVKDRAIWATRADQVPLTEDEKAEAAAEEKTGNALISQMAKEMARAGSDAVREMRFAK
jgi:hypothetical protein